MIKKLISFILCMFFLVANISTALAFLPPGTGGGEFPPLPPPPQPPQTQPSQPQQDVLSPFVFIEASATSLPAQSQLTITANVVDTGGANTGVSYFKIKENGIEIYSKNCNNAASCSGAVTISRTKGTYIYSVEARDAAGNINNAESTEPDYITVIFQNRMPSKPSLLSPANNVYVLTSNPLFSWTASSDPDNDAITYDLEIDGIATNIASTTYAPTLIDGSHAWRVRARDNENGISDWTETRIVKVDTLYPQVINSNIPDIELGNNVLIQVDVIEANLVSVRVEIDGSANYPMSLLSGNTYAYTLLSPSLGTHNARYYALDGVGRMNNSVSDSFGVVDSIAPVFNPVPQNQIIELGQPFNYDVNATDSSMPLTYSVDNPSFTIDNSTGLIRNATALGLNVYLLQISAKDSQNNTNTASITVMVQDTIAPVFNPVPQNQIVEFGNNLNYQVHATDLQSIVYSVNDTTNFAISADGNITNVLLLNVGNYGLQITATDASGNSNTADIIISVSDTISPAWNPMPEDQQAEYNNATWNYTVHATDLQSIIYTISDIINFAIDAVSGIITKLTSILGSYKVQINATDASANVNSTNITINITDHIAPDAFDLLIPVNGTISQNTTQTFTWQQSNDVYFNKYTVQFSKQADFSIIDEQYELAGVANTSVQAALENDTAYYWRVIAYDTSGNNRTSSNTFVYVTDNIAPSLTSLTFIDNGCNGSIFSPNGDGVCENATINATANEIVDNWVSVKFYNAMNGSIYKYYYPSSDNTSSMQQTWDGSLTAGTLVDGLYEIQIKMRDAAGNENTLVAGAAEVDNTAPLYSNISRTADPIYGDMDVLLNITWNDANIAGVLIEHNASGTWQNASITQQGSKYTAVISNADISAGNVVGWRSRAEDKAGNYNVSTEDVFIVQNHAPASSIIPNQTWNEDTLKTINLNNYFSDQDSDSLTFDSTAPANINVSINQTTGIATLTPDADFNGVRYITFNATDSVDSVSSNQVTLTVTAVNDAPAALDDSIATDEDVSVLIDVLANDTDVEDGVPGLNVISVSPLNGAAFIDAGQVNYTPNANFNGIDTLTYRVIDSGGLTDTAVVTITVNSINDAPAANNDSYAVDEDAVLNIPAAGVLANDIDADLDSLTAVLDVDVANGTLALNSNGSFGYTPNPEFSGADAFAYHAYDGTNNSNIATVTITINPVNDAPVWTTNISSQNVSEDFGTIAVETNLSAYVNDADGDAVIFTVQTENTSQVDCAIAGTQLSIISAANWNGVASCTIRADDGNGGTADNAFSITVNPVNDAPSFNPALENQSANVGRAFVYDINANDVENDVLTFSGNATQFIINSSIGLINFTPLVEETIDVLITVSDGINMTLGSFILTVNAPISTLINSWLNANYYFNTSSYNTTGVYNSDIENSNVSGIINISNSQVINSTLVDSTANYCTILDSILYGTDCFNQTIDPSDVRYSNIAGSDITDSHVWYSNATYSIIVDSAIDNSTVNNSNLNNSVIGNQSNVADSNLINSTVTNSTVSASSITNTNLDNVTVTNSAIANSDTLINTIINDASITNNVIYNGTIAMYNGTIYNATASRNASLAELINFAPKADFTYNSNYLAVSFADLSSDLNINSTLNDSLTYLWSFGDASTGNTANALHAYGSAGTYNVMLTVIDIFNQSDSKSMMITVSTQQSTYSGGGGSCLSSWKCTGWSECSKDGKQTRICSDSGRCGISYGKPAETQNCAYTPQQPITNGTANETKINETQAGTEGKGVIGGIIGITGKAISTTIEFSRQNPIFFLAIVAALIVFIIMQLAKPKKGKNKKLEKEKKEKWHKLEEEEEIIPIHVKFARHVAKHAKRAHKAVKHYAKKTHGTLKNHFKNTHKSIRYHVKNAHKRIKHHVKKTHEALKNHVKNTHHAIKKHIRKLAAKRKIKRVVRARKRRR